MNLLGAAVAVLWAAMVPATADAAYVAADDFSIGNGNPNGAWSYGWTLNDFSGFTLYANSGTEPTWGVPYWNIPDPNPPSIWKNTHSDGLFGVPKDWLSLQPHANTETSVLRWTAPSDGDVEVTGEFLAGEGGGQTVVVRLNNSPWWSPGSDHGAFNLQTTVAAGGTIDFAVTGSDYFGNTPLSAAISYVPEPSGLGLLGVGLIVLLRQRARAA